MYSMSTLVISVWTHIRCKLTHVGVHPEFVPCRRVKTQGNGSFLHNMPLVGVHKDTVVDHLKLPFGLSCLVGCAAFLNALDALFFVFVLPFQYIMMWAFTITSS